MIKEKRGVEKERKLQFFVSRRGSFKRKAEVCILATPALSQTQKNVYVLVP